MKEGTIVKIFLGEVITAHMKLLLQENEQWKNDNISKETNLSIIPFQNKEYIGMFLEKMEPTLHDISISGKFISKEFEKYFPEMNTNLKLFSQVFLK